MSTNKPIDFYLKSLKKGERCIDEFVNAYTGKIRFIAYRYLVDKSFTNDVVTNTFDRIFAHIDTYDENQQGMAWVCKIAQNEAYKINDRERKHDHVALDEISEEVASVNDVAGSIEFMAALHNSIDKMDETDQKIVLMRITEDLTFSEIAKRLGMHVGTVHKRFKRAANEIIKKIL